jgi:crotonobetainyl-CoA:carnitine CoA-transferase CaiB-like acyl-CoA transferase
VTSRTSTRTRAQLAHDLQAAGVLCAPVKSIREVDTDPHLIQGGVIQYIEHPTRGRPPSPAAHSASPTHQSDRYAPPLDQTTHELTTVDAVTIPGRH